MERDNGAGRRRLPQGDVGDGASAAEDADPTLALTSIRGHRVKDIAAGVDFQDVGSKGVGAFSGDNNRWLRFIFRTGRSASRAAGHDFAAGVGLMGVVVVVIAAVELVRTVVGVQRPLQL